MKRLIGAAAFAACLVVPATIASAATIQLDGVGFNGVDFTFNYGGTLAPTEGVRSGSKLVILDFAGYVGGSILSIPGFISGIAEMSTAGIVLEPGVFDDPNVENLVFTYIGADFQVTPAAPGLPYAPIDFTGLTARSIYGNVELGQFATVTVKNENGIAVGTNVFSTGKVAVPSPVPEPGTWAMLLGGLGLVGAAMRRRPDMKVSFA